LAEQWKTQLADSHKFTLLATKRFNNESICIITHYKFIIYNWSILLSISE